MYASVFFRWIFQLFFRTFFWYPSFCATNTFFFSSAPLLLIYSRLLYLWLLFLSPLDRNCQPLLPTPPQIDTFFILTSFSHTLNIRSVTSLSSSFSIFHYFSIPFPLTLDDRFLCFKWKFSPNSTLGQQQQQVLILLLHLLLIPLHPSPLANILLLLLLIQVFSFLFGKKVT